MITPQVVLRLQLNHCIASWRTPHYTHLPISDVSPAAQSARSFPLPTERRSSSTYRETRSEPPLCHSLGAALLRSSRNRSIHWLESIQVPLRRQRQTERCLMRGTPDVIEGERFRTRGSRGPVISPQFTEWQLSHDLEIGVHDADDCSSRNCGQLA
jgi:hypothetical protein